MAALVIGFLAVLAFLGFSNREAGKFMLAASWAFMILFGLGSCALGFFNPAFR
jgi:hypothetical protein